MWPKSEYGQGRCGENATRTLGRDEITWITPSLCGSCYGIIIPGPDGEQLGCERVRNSHFKHSVLRINYCIVHLELLLKVAF